METLSSLFSDTIQSAISLFRAPTYITGDNVYQEADKRALALVDSMVERLALPGSGLSGIDNLYELLQKARGGSSCLLLLEHYSNMDLPQFSYLLRKEDPRGAEINDALISIAGMKLNEENPAIAVFSGGYTRIIICPSRVKDGTPAGADTEKEKAERLRMININRSAMRKLEELKRTGRIVLLFPAGTRYRPWDTGSKRGVREVDSYIKNFDYMCLVALNGEVLHIRQGGMIDDFVSEDVLRITASPMISCGEFREKALLEAAKSGVEDKRQAVVDAVMRELDIMHNEAEMERQKIDGSSAKDQCEPPLVR
ncbi:MAG: 1-acyl-sn-glycerol-3-phosphate acyltransferase [Spirochaetaceae bacterium]|jgi:glycerol-3-phosphate O-acyltransferase|nr:1-acyl-sn-glycerol-3-phosphate acyltransferase [Spirochaetaceae bacterium]